MGRFLFVFLGIVNVVFIVVFLIFMVEIFVGVINSIVGSLGLVVICLNVFIIVWYINFVIWFFLDLLFLVRNRYIGLILFGFKEWIFFILFWYYDRSKLYVVCCLMFNNFIDFCSKLLEILVG